MIWPGYVWKIVLETRTVLAQKSAAPMAVVTGVWLQVPNISIFVDVYLLILVSSCNHEVVYLRIMKLLDYIVQLGNCIHTQSRKFARCAWFSVHMDLFMDRMIVHFVNATNLARWVGLTILAIPTYNINRGILRIELSGHLTSYTDLVSVYFTLLFHYWSCIFRPWISSIDYCFVWCSEFSLFHYFRFSILTSHWSLHFIFQRTIHALRGKSALGRKSNVKKLHVTQFQSVKVRNDVSQWATIPYTCNIFIVQLL